jgi:hypothetical protein
VSNANSAKGSAFERDARTFLAVAFGRAVQRPHHEGFKDVGDLHLSPFVLQCKNYANVAEALNVGVAGAQIQAVHAGEPYGVALIKKRNSGIAEARVAMTLATFRRVVARLRRAEELLARHAPEVFHEIHLPETKKDI